jgi:transposase
MAGLNLGLKWVFSWHKLKESGMTYRQIAKIARCSAGAVGAEMRAWKKEKILEQQKQNELDEATSKITLDFSPRKESNQAGGYEGMNFNFSEDMEKVDFELER